MSRRALHEITDLPAANQGLAVEIGKAVGKTATSLPEAISQVRGHLPAGVVADLARVQAIESWLAHPQLSRQIDLDEVRRVHRKTRRYLAKIDLKRDRERYWFGVAAGLAINILLLAIGLIAFLRWRGLI